MAESTQRERIRGALWGLAWGDVYGCPIEMWTPEEIKEVYGSYSTLPTEYPEKKIKALNPRLTRYRRALGVHSDDTQQCMALLNLCMRPQGFNVEDWGKVLVVGSEQKAWRGTGRFFRSAVKNLSMGLPPQKSGAPSAGMGAAMRTGPLGALLRDDQEELWQVCMESSLTTHATWDAAFASYAVALTVFRLVNGESVDKVRETLASDLRWTDPKWSESLQGWQCQTIGHPNVFQMALQEALLVSEKDMSKVPETILRFADQHLKLDEPHVNGGAVLLGCVNAIVTALQPGGKPGDILASILRQGGDTDTVGAICGSILGARFGSKWIPKNRIVANKRVKLYAEALLVDQNGGKTSPRETIWELIREEAELGKASQFVDD